MIVQPVLQAEKVMGLELGLEDRVSTVDHTLYPVGSRLARHLFGDSR